MAVVFQDNFNRADANLAAGGDGWTQVDGTAGWGAVRSNGLACLTADSAGAAYQCSDIGSTRQYVQAKLTNVSIDSGPFLALRLADRNNFIGIRYFGLSGPTIEAYKRIGGTLTSLIPGTITCALNDVIRFEVDDINWRILKNGVQVSSGSDSAIAGLTSTRAGVVMRAFVSNPWIDDFEAGRPSYNFPFSPTAGQIYAPGGMGPGATWYIWDGTVWLRSRSNVGPPASGFRNYIINGNHLLWQRGNTFGPWVGTGYTADRWYAYSNGTTLKTVRQGNPMGGMSGIYPAPVPPAALQGVTVSSPGASNYAIIEQRIEGARTLAGRRATLSFWAVSTAANFPFSVEMYQYTGSGGSPSAGVSFFQKKLALNLSPGAYQKFVLSFDVPSLLGKTLGSAGDDGLWVRFWLDAGSAYDSQTGALGQRSGNINIANVQLEAGNVATPFEERPPVIEWALCQRYYEAGYRYCFFTSPSSGGYADTFDLPFMVHKRTTPTMTRAQSSQQVFASCNDWATYPYVSFCQIVASGAGVAGCVVTWTADAELR